jgi:D-aminoacyl-tRNA deacylase
MKFVIQRVKEASVKVSGETVGSINKGLLVLIGLTHTDKESDIQFAANKLLNLRLWDDTNGNRWKESVKSLNLEILLVSQFTLYSILKGNKPDFHNALDPEPALRMYEKFVETLKKNYSGNIQCGKFGAMMEVSLINDGPVTINWEYPETKNETSASNSASGGEKIDKKEVKNKSNKHSKLNSKNENTEIDLPITDEELKKFEDKKLDEINLNCDKKI